MKVFGVKLEKGEQTRLRLPREGRSEIYRLLLLIPLVPLLLAALVMYFTGQAERMGYLRHLIPGAGVLLIFISHDLFHGWRVIITDRRLLHKASGSGSAIEEMRFESIERVTHDLAGNRLVVRGTSGEIVIPLDNMDANEIRAALGR